MQFTIPGPPQVKQRPRFARGRAFTPKATEEYEKFVAQMAYAAVKQFEWSPLPGATFHLDVEIYRAAKRGDLTNFLKSIEDGMNGIVFRDDKDVRQITAVMHDDKANPRAVVRVTELS